MYRSDCSVKSLTCYLYIYMYTNFVSDSSHDHVTRVDMKLFWEEHSRDASEQEMMLDSNAETLGKEEV